MENHNHQILSHYFSSPCTESSNCAYSWGGRSRDGMGSAGC